MTDAIEPRWLKRTTLLKLHEARRDYAAKCAAVREAESIRDEAQAAVKQLELEAAEWMRRDKTQTEVVLTPDAAKSMRQVRHAIVFTRTDDGVCDTVVEPVR